MESHWVNYLTVTDSYRRIKKITAAETVPEPRNPLHPTEYSIAFEDVTNGAIRIGGVDVRDMSYDELLGSVSIVMRNVRLFPDTIEGNIRLGKAAATQEEIVAAAEKARIHDFIMSLPDGYQTMIGKTAQGFPAGRSSAFPLPV